MNEKAAVQGFNISEKSAAIIGCGGLGTNAAVHLAGAGIGKLLLWDFDSVEVRNLNRQFMYTAKDTGKAKSLVLRQKLEAYAPDCRIHDVCEKIETAASLSLLRAYDIVILAVDNIPCRKTVGTFCEENGIACINGSINGFFGTAFLCVPGKTATLEQAGALDESTAKQFSPSTTAGIIGALEAKLAINYFLNLTDSFGTLYCYDGETIESMKIRGENNDKA